MATPGISLAEVYVLRKLHKEKMKRSAKEERAGRDDVNVSHHGKQSSGGCFSLVFNKVHPKDFQPPIQTENNPKHVIINYT
uniref:Uncharacterized protein n=1 Tax=Vitis vinifera TaxID=29760 RepID=F6H0U6_VITVI